MSTHELRARRAPILEEMRVIKAAREQWQRQRQCRSDLMAWTIKALDPFGQRPACHHIFLMTELEEVARGEVDRLMRRRYSAGFSRQVTMRRKLTRGTTRNEPGVKG